MRPWAHEAFKKRLPKRSCLRPESARSMLHAERFASALKRNLNVFLTINFNTQPRDPDSNYYDIFRTKIWANIRRRWKAHCKRQGIQRPFAAIASSRTRPIGEKGHVIMARNMPTPCWNGSPTRSSACSILSGAPWLSPSRASGRATRARSLPDAHGAQRATW